MKINVFVKPNSKKNEVTEVGDKVIQVRVNVPPIEGKANEKVIELLSEYYGRPRRSISIISGHKGKRKIVEIL